MALSTPAARRANGWIGWRRMEGLTIVPALQEFHEAPGPISFKLGET
jgi:hypothetical protein